MRLSCPDCGNELIAENMHGLILETCPACGGIWFKQDQLRQLLAQDSNALAKLKQPQPPQQVEHGFQGLSTLNCPEDGTRLQEYHYLYNSPVVLHQCSGCGGFWVRQGDLDKMQQYVRQDQAPATKYEQLLAAEAQDEAQHYAYMRRQQNMAGFFNLLSWFVPGWYGGFPF